MEEKLKQALRQKKIREMKDPEILINESDFKALEEIAKKDVANFHAGPFLKYNGVQIRASKLVEVGTIVIFDAACTDFI